MRGFADLAEHLAAGGLIEARPRTHLAQGIQHARHPQAGGFSGQHRLLPAGRHERHAGQVVNFIRLNFFQNPHDRRLIVQVPRKQVDEIADMFEAMAVIIAAVSADHAADAVALADEELRQMGAVLPVDSGDESSRHRASPRVVGSPFPAQNQIVEGD